MNYLLSIIALVLVACAPSNPRSPEWWMEGKPSACLPTAIAFKEGLKNQAVWSEVLLYEYADPVSGKTLGHAVTAYMYPVGKNQLWTYDHEGSTRIRAYITDIEEIAQQTENMRGRPHHRITKAEFLK